MGKRVSFADGFGDVLDVTDASSAPPTTAPLGELAPNPDNPRDPQDLDVQELADTLRDHGQLQPATVVARDVFLSHYPHHADVIGDAPWVVINGNRRLAAAHVAGLPTLDISVKNSLGEGDNRIDEAVMIENIHRQALHPLREARFLQRMVSKPGGSLRTVGKRIGKTHVYVQQRISLLKLIPELQQALLDGTLGIKDARPLAGLDSEAQRTVWEAGAPYMAPAPPEEGVNPVTTPPASSNSQTEPVSSDAVKPEPGTTGTNSRATLPMEVFRVPAHDPSALATAVRARLSPAEITELIGILTSP